MSVRAALAAGAARLGAVGIDGAGGDARRLMAPVLGIAPGRVSLHLGDELSPDQQAGYRALIERRAGREPVSHLLGGRLFFGRWFTVTADVLDPRPETECLVAAALRHEFDRVLDLGTGSGAILLTLLAERPGARGTGTDLSDAALAVAARNAARLGLEGRVRWRRADWLAGLEERYDLIVSNPPYVTAAEMDRLAPELAHEPRLALTDGGDGLSPYRTIAAGAGAHLVSGGRLTVETGARQGAAVAEVFERAGFARPAILPDLDGRDRIVTARWPG